MFVLNANAPNLHTLKSNNLRLTKILVPGTKAGTISGHTGFDVGVIELIGATEVNQYFAVAPDVVSLMTGIDGNYVVSGGRVSASPGVYVGASSRIVSIDNLDGQTLKGVFVRNRIIKSGATTFESAIWTTLLRLIKIQIDGTIEELASLSFTSGQGNYDITRETYLIPTNPVLFSNGDRIGLEMSVTYVSGGSNNVLSDANISIVAGYGTTQPIIFF